MKFLQSLLAFALSAPAIVGVLGATLQQVTNYGGNPGNVDMFYYVPDCLVGNTAGRPIVVALHYCHGTAKDMFNGVHDGPSYKTLAERLGFVALFPNVNNDPDGCFDVTTEASLHRGGGGESDSIANQVDYLVANYGLDANRVYVIGLSGGAMMVNVLAATYPDKFAGGSVFAGVAHGCFSSNTGWLWSHECATGLVTKTPAEWGDLVRSAYPGYTGPRPKIQTWHNNPDQVLFYVNLEEQVKQWTNIFGYNMESPQSISYGSPTSAWTRTVYGPNFETLTSTIYAHVFPIDTEDSVRFFGLTSDVPPACAAPTLPEPSTTTTAGGSSPTTTTVPGPSSTTVPRWYQCAGVGYTGPTVCEAGYVCTVINDYYSQCT